MPKVFFTLCIEVFSYKDVLISLFFDISGGNSNEQHNISSWEKRFVTSSIPWKQFLEAKKYAYLYNNVLNWDDSAAEEAFKIAKEAFYANLHGIPYDVKSHDPDCYNNKIDWNSQENNDLIRDFESESVVEDIDSNHEPVVIFGDALPDPYKDYAPYGWGDADDKVKESCGVSDDLNKGDGDGKIICGDQGWNETDNKAVDGGWNCNDHKAVDQEWDYNVNEAGDQGWNNYAFDYNNYYPSYGNNNNNYYGNGYNERYETYNFIGHNSYRSRTWRNNGNRSKSNGQGYGRQRAHGSTMPAYGGQPIHVNY